MWDCCHIASHIARNGVVHTYTYDEDGRKLSETKVGYGTQPHLIVSYICNPAGKVLTKTTTSDALPLTESNTYDAAERVISSTDYRGLTTTYRYNGNKTTITLPGATMISKSYTDGSMKLQTGTARVHECYSQGVENNAIWEKTNIASANSPRLQKSLKNMLG